MAIAEQEVFQIHLLPASASRRLETHAALAAAALASGKEPPPKPRIDFEHFGGRGVRYRLLTPEERDQVLTIAAKTVGLEATYPELAAQQSKEAAKKMLVAVTKKSGLETLDGLGPTEWEPLTDAKLAGLKDDSFRFERIFTPKDVMVLKSIYRRLHEATEADVDAIEGKAIPVSSE